MSADDQDQTYKSKAKSVYVAGPMAGFEEYNYPLFHEVSEILRAEGFRVVNPAELDSEVGWPETTPTDDYYVGPAERAGYMNRDLPYVLACDALCLLPDWEDSTGANIELLTALVSGKEVWAWVEGVEGDLVLTYAADLRPNLWAIVQHVEAVTS